MTGASRVAVGLAMAAALTVVIAQTSNSHNNPATEAQHLHTLEVTGDEALSFTLDPPKRTVQLVWRIVEGDEAITFDVLDGEKTVITGAHHEGTTRFLRGGPFTIANIEGGTPPFTIEIWGNVAQGS